MGIKAILVDYSNGSIAKFLESVKQEFSVGEFREGLARHPAIVVHALDKVTGKETVKQLKTLAKDVGRKHVLVVEDDNCAIELGVDHVNLSRIGIWQEVSESVGRNSKEGYYILDGRYFILD